MKKTLLVVLAHPDDESFGPGGTLALYARQGVSVHLVCATRGEAGDVSPELLGDFRSVADLREAELRCAAEELGLDGLYLLGYRDSGMAGSESNRHPEALAATPVDEVATKIAFHIRSLQPQVVLTFAPDGGYGHPDHIAIHKATLRAIELAAQPDAEFEGLRPHRAQKLYYHTFPSKRLRWAVRLLPLFGRNPRQWGRNRDIDLVEIAQRSFPTHAQIDVRPVLEVKQRASACHASQLEGGPPRAPALNWLLGLTNGREYFMRALPEASKSTREKDLFGDVK